MDLRTLDGTGGRSQVRQDSENELGGSSIASIPTPPDKILPTFI